MVRRVGWPEVEMRAVLESEHAAERFRSASCIEYPGFLRTTSGRVEDAPSVIEDPWPLSLRVRLLRPLRQRCLVHERKICAD